MSAIYDGSRLNDMSSHFSFMHAKKKGFWHRKLAMANETKATASLTPKKKVVEPTFFLGNVHRADWGNLNNKKLNAYSCLAFQNNHEV